MPTVSSSGRVPYALQEAIVQACGTVFYYKRPLSDLLIRCGVPPKLVKDYEGEKKFIMVRSILAELDQRGEAGVRVQQQIVEELAAMQDVRDPDNREAGLKALADLRATAKQLGLLDDDAAELKHAAARKKAAAERAQVIAARDRGLRELHATYMKLLTSPEGEQARGYDLQDLLAALFKLHDIPYKPPYRKGNVEETDGFFTFDSFSYLVEARWRNERPPLTDLRAFSSKVKARIESTRGFFLSIPGFRDEVVDEARTLANLILMDGHELALVLEGRISLVEGLRIKIEKASKEGRLYYSLGQHF